MVLVVGLLAVGLLHIGLYTITQLNQAVEAPKKKITPVEVEIIKLSLIRIIKFLPGSTNSE